MVTRISIQLVKMTERIHVNSIHEYYNERFKTEAKLYEKMIEQLNAKITSLKTELSTANRTNQSLKSRLNSANNMIRILTSNRELDYDFTKVDCLLRAKLIDNNCDEAAAQSNRQHVPKKAVDSTRNINLKKVQNKPAVLQRRNFLKTQSSQVTSTNNVIENQKAKPVAKVNAKASKIPVFTKPSNGSLVSKKENTSALKNTTVAKRKAESAAVKADVKKSKGNSLLKENTMQNRLKVRVVEDTERKLISMNKTFSIDH